MPERTLAQLPALVNTYDGMSLGNTQPNSTPITVTDVGAIGIMEVASGYRRVVGPEYVLAHYGTTAALAATTVVLKVLLPPNREHVLTSYDVYYRVNTTNTVSANWDVTLEGYGGTSTFDTSTNDADTFYSHTDTTLGVVNADSTYLTVTATKHDSPGTLDLMVLIRLKDIYYDSTP